MSIRVRFASGPNSSGSIALPVPVNTAFQPLKNENEMGESAIGVMG
jgi:hypothetical protein